MDPVNVLAKFEVCSCKGVDCSTILHTVRAGND